MKIVFDEHIAPGLVKVFKILASEGDMVDCEIFSARDYKLPEDGKSDAPWLVRFAEAGGNVVISGDARMRSVPQEREALLRAGMTIFFFQRKWNQLSRFQKSGFLLCWWPKLMARAKNGPIGCLEIPLTWTPTDFKEIQLYDPKK